MKSFSFLVGKTLEDILEKLLGHRAQAIVWKQSSSHSENNGLETADFSALTEGISVRQGKLKRSQKTWFPSGNLKYI